MWGRGLWMGVAALLIAPAAAGAGTAVTGACPWTEFTRVPGVSTYPDTDTQVYQCAYSVGPLHETVIDGRAPHARFWSFAVIDQARAEVASLPDDRIQVRPDGTYTIRIAADCSGATNCLDLKNAPAPYAPGLIYYRVYVPDGDDTGGVGLPRVTYRATVGPDEAQSLDADGALAAYYAQLTTPLEPGGTAYETLAGASGADRPVTADKTGAAPQAQRYQGLGTKQLDNLRQEGVPGSAVDALRTVLGAGGFGATADNAYATLDYDMTAGNVVLHAKGPTYRGQHVSAANDLGRSDGSEQVRYWSLCTTQLTRPVDCVRDEQVPVDADGFFTAIIAPSCPVAGYAVCLRSGAASPAGRAQAATLLYRNTLARPDFYDADGPTTCPSANTMYCGDYALTARYVPRP